ncbi:hypothetical protein [Vibrio aestuarianus]|uniref:hypothetical protein n=1 Tax=Vibrio aestuarianus TaxID=28171 RepID=UPI00237CEA4F|nr:hypothetical protein [Vibrio aestuarianus]MDE1240344.1 hypothetical protein [Vibrio aestuarianus]
MKERMETLLNADVISQHAHDATLKATDLLIEEWKVDIETDQIQMAMTHFSRAIDRIQLGNAVTEGLDPEILAEILEDENFSSISVMNEKLCTLAELEEVPETENSFFLSNLYAMYLQRS